VAPLRRGVSPANQQRLLQDLSYGEPVQYRRVPGPGRRYYDPKRPENPAVTEDYVLRVYKPRVSEESRQIIREYSRRSVTQQARLKRSLAATWMEKQAQLGTPVTNINFALKQPEFNALYQRFRVVAYEARHTPIESPFRAGQFAADSEYAQVLAMLGRRIGTEPWYVGDSPSHVGPGESYIDNVVLPYLRSHPNV
jgi:hypothetical protein